MKSVNQMFRYLQDLLNSSRKTKRTGARGSLENVEAVESRMLLTADLTQSLYDPLILNEVAAVDQVDSFLVKFDNAVDAEAVADQVGASSVVASRFIDNGHTFTFENGITVQEGADAFFELPNFEYVYPIVEFTPQTEAIPNDPLFADQWQHNNTGQSGGIPGEDLNVVPAWDIATGAGVTVGIVDGGLETGHEDLAPNVNTAIDFDYIDNDDDPNPANADDNHGTSVAGNVAAKGNNGIGGTGAAWDAELVGIRLIGGAITDLDVANALVHENQIVDIYNNSWGIARGGQVAPSQPQSEAAIIQGNETGRGGLGNIYVWSAGNGALENTNGNYRVYSKLRQTIAVGALLDDGTRAPYSNPGATTIVSAPADPVITTDRTGADGYTDTNYTTAFNGTSSAAPHVSGVIALMLEANPDLSYRDVVDILVHTSRRNDATNTDWVQNGGGLWVNHEYGFGAIDASAAVSAALTHEFLPDEEFRTTGVVNVGQAINDLGTVTQTFQVTDNLSLEHVELVFDATHSFIGDLEVVLTSPSGTQSVLAETRIQDGASNYSNYTFMSARHWDEFSQGEWTVTVRDGLAGDSGTFNSFELRMYGTEPVGLRVEETGDSTVVSDYQVTDQVLVSLPLQPTSDVVVDISNSDPSEVELSATQLTFTPANWNVQQTVTLTGVLDLAPDGPQTTTLTFRINDALSDDFFDGLEPVSISVRSLDDDRTIPFKPTLTNPDQFPDDASPVFAWIPGDRSDNFTLTVTDVLSGVTLQQQSGITASTFAFELPFPDGLYSAQLTPFNSAGQPGPASDPLIFNIGDPIVPAAPLIVSPDTGDVVTTSFPSIQWNAVPGAAEYEIFIRTGQSVSRLHTEGVDEGNGVLSYTPTQPLGEGSTSVWIRGVNFFGTYGDWSAPVRFTINSVDLPGIPRLTAPLLSVTSNAFPIFEWTAVENAARYELWVSELREGTGTAQVQAVYDRVIHVTNTNETSYQHFNPLSERPHRAWVRAFNSAGETSGWSSFISFEVDIPDPVVPTVAGNSNTQDLTPTFTWSTVGETPGTTYRLWVNNLSTGQNRVIDVSGISGGSYTPTVDLDQGRLAVWVQASTASGVRSAWSPRAIVTVDVLPPDQGVVVGPRVDDGATSSVVESEFPTWEWQAVPNAERYELWVNHVETGTTRLIHRTDLTGTTYTHDTPVLEGTLRAWVRGINKADEVGPWSAVFDVEIDVPLPSKPVIGAPTPNAVGAVEDATPIIRWNTADPGITYDVQVRDVVSGELVINVTGVEGLSYEVPSELDERRFEARVRGLNSIDEAGEWSDWYGFRVDVPNATTPTAIGPVGTVTTDEVTFVWQHSSDSIRYEILVQDLRNRENTVISVTTFDVNTATGTASYTEPLEDGTYRFWVRAFNSQNTASGWSNSLSFTVEDRFAKLDAEDAPDALLASLSTRKTAQKPDQVHQVVEYPQVQSETSEVEEPVSEFPIAAMPVVDASERAIQDVMAQLAEASDSVIL